MIVILPFDVGPLATQLALFSDFSRFDLKKIRIKKDVLYYVIQKIHFFFLKKEQNKNIFLKLQRTRPALSNSTPLGSAITVGIPERLLTRDGELAIGE